MTRRYVRQIASTDKELRACKLQSNETADLSKETLSERLSELYHIYHKTEIELDRYRNNVIAFVETLEPDDEAWRQFMVHEATQGDWIRFADVLVDTIKKARKK